MSHAGGRPEGLGARKTAFELIAKGPLRLLTRFGGAELTDRLGLREPAGRALHAGASFVARAAAAASKLAPKPSPPERLKGVKAGHLFDLTPDEDQDAVRKAARRFADEVLRPAAREADEAASPPREVLERSHELALAGLVTPEAFGGAAESRSGVTSALVAEELARGDMGLALAALSPLAVVNALVDWGTREQQETWLPRFTGERFTPAAFALLERHPLFDPMRPRTSAVRSGGGFLLYGEKAFVPLAAEAEVLLVAADVRGAGPRLFLVERGAKGVTAGPDPAMGLRGAGLCRVRLDGVRLGPSALLGGEAPRGFDFGDAVDRSRVAWGAMAVGGSQAVLDYVIPYCNERRAFGEPVSHRQAVAFLIADLAIEIEGMRLLVHRAAGLADRGASIAREARLARVQCAAKGMKVGTDGVQLLGGHGFIKEHPVERWYRDLRAVGLFEGALLA